MKEVCEEISEALKVTYPDRELHVHCDGDLQGQWDADRLKELLTNLTKNALEYGKRDAPVSVSACAEATEVVLSVHNWGTPIARERHATIFDPLKRGAIDKQEHRSPDSMGLGLYIVKAITEAHGGTVHLTSDQEAGTTFTVRLPRDSATAPP
jgi:signal transduction histidine kinase